MSDDLASAVRAAVQAVLDAAPDPGWHAAQFCILLGLEKVRDDGTLEAIPWMWAPPDQADWMTGGLIEAAVELRHWQQLQTEDED